MEEVRIWRGRLVWFADVGMSDPCLSLPGIVQPLGSVSSRALAGRSRVRGTDARMRRYRR